MVTERAIVIRCQGGRAEVAVQRNSTCGGCELASGCGTGAIGRLLGNRQKPITIETDRALDPGTEVLLGLSERTIVRASCLIYGLPLIGLLVFSVFSQTVFAWPEWATVLAALTGLCAGFLLARLIGSRLVNHSFSLDVIDIRMNPGQLPES